MAVVCFWKTLRRGFARSIAPDFVTLTRMCQGGMRAPERETLKDVWLEWRDHLERENLKRLRSDQRAESWCTWT